MNPAGVSAAGASGGAFCFLVGYDQLRSERKHKSVREHLHLAYFPLSQLLLDLRQGGRLSIRGEWWNDVRYGA
jgi:hypothetical protein